MKSKDKKLTSVRVLPELWDEFQEKSKPSKFSFQKLAEVSMHKFNTDEDFKFEVLNYTKHIGQ
jgi:hypothetical protein